MSIPRYRNFYPRSPCGERHQEQNPAPRTGIISIHALLAESDMQLMGNRKPEIRFLSTLSLRRATVQRGPRPHERGHFYPRSPCGERPILCTSKINMSNFYPRSPCGERPTKSASSLPSKSISIHALRAESDGVHFDNFNLHCVISIHALLAESDTLYCPPFGEIKLNFYPRSPCGERPNQTNLPGWN